jgi:hypothetical protein
MGADCRDGSIKNALPGGTVTADGGAWRDIDAAAAGWLAARAAGAVMLAV